MLRFSADVGQYTFGHNIKIKTANKKMTRSALQQVLMRAEKELSRMQKEDGFMQNGIVVQILCNGRILYDCYTGFYTKKGQHA